MFHEKFFTIEEPIRVVLKAPGMSGRFQVQSRKQQLCYEQVVIFDLLDPDFQEWLEETAILETLVTEAPDEWFVEIPVQGKEKRVVRLISNDKLDDADIDAIREVGRQAKAFLSTFRGQAESDGGTA